MAQLTVHPSEAPKPEDEGLTLKEIHWLPLVVPLCAVLMALAGAAIMSVA